MSGTALILQHGETAPPGLLARWCVARGVPYAIHHAGSGPLPALDGQPFVASLGSKHNPDDAHVGEVAAERAFLTDALARDVPVLGLCFGGQMLSSVLGGMIDDAPEPELGWHAVQTEDDDVVPGGPWLQWHFHRFSVPAGAQALATSPVGPQAFAHGRHLGVQFHPESTIEIVTAWARADRERLAALGIDDGETRLERGRRHAEAAAAAAFDLFDAFWQRTRT
jgi:GMP synthase-like glutamine amidotransferase